MLCQYMLLHEKNEADKRVPRILGHLISAVGVAFQADRTHNSSQLTPPLGHGLHISAHSEVPFSCTPVCTE